MEYCPCGDQLFIQVIKSSQKRLRKLTPKTGQWLGHTLKNGEAKSVLSSRDSNAVL